MDGILVSLFIPPREISKLFKSIVFAQDDIVDAVTEQARLCDTKKVYIYLSLGRNTRDDMDTLEKYGYVVKHLGYDYIATIARKRSPYIICIDGEIGSGKTTLIAHLKDIFTQYGYNVTNIPEPIQHWRDINVFQSFYNDMKANTNQFQAYTYFTRIREMITAKKDCDMYLMERSPSSSHVFMDVLREYVTDEQYQQYYRWCDMWGQLAEECCTIYIRLKPSMSVCLDRIKKRGRVEEKNMSAEYMAKLRCAYDRLEYDLIIDSYIADKKIETTRLEISSMILDRMIQSEYDKPPANIVGDTKVIIFDGIIAAGKTTLIIDTTKELQKLGLLVVVAEEPIKQWLKTGIFQKFNQDKKKYAYEFQTNVLESRVQVMKEAYEKKADIILMERSIFTDYAVFGKVLIKEGCFTKEQEAMYNNWIKEQSRLIPKAFNNALHIYIKPSIKTCMERLRKRGREGEELISEKYQLSLSAAYDEYFDTVKNKHVLCDDHIDVKKIIEIIC